MPEAASQHCKALLVVAAGTHEPGALIRAARRHGYEVTACATPAEALAWAVDAAQPLVLAAGETAEELADFCRALRRLPNGAACEVLAVCDAPAAEATALLLAAGATDVLATSAGDDALGVRLAVLTRHAGQRALAWAGAARAEAEALLEATATLGVQADPEDVIRVLVEHAVKLLDAEIGTYAIGHDDMVVSTVFQNGAWLPGAYKVPLGRSIAGLVWRTGVPYRTNDLANDPHTLSTVDQRYGLHSQIVVPLSGSGADRLGLLALANSRRPDGFSERDERLLIAFCEYGSLVLTRARDAAARLAAEAEAARRRREVEALLEAAAHLNRAAEPADVLVGLIEVAVRLLETDGAVIITNEGDHGFLRHAWMDGAWHSLAIAVPLGSSVAGHVMRTGEPYMTADVANDPLIFHAPNGVYPRHGLLCVPILGPGGALGTLSLFDRHDGAPFSADDLRLAQGIAQHAAAALARSTLMATVRANEERWQHIIETTPDLICVLDLDGRFVFANSAFRVALDRDPDALRGTLVFSLAHPDDVPAIQEAFQRRVEGPTNQPSVGVNLRVAHADGGWLHVEAKGRPLHDAAGALTGLLIIGRDVTARRALQEQLTRQAFHDPLTGLPNRALFTDRLEHALARGERGGRTVAVMFLDLDRFKVVNDSRGHGVGDQLLVAVGQRLADCLRPGDTVARFGGDEFIVLIEDMLQQEDATRVAERIVQALRLPFLVDGHELFTATSIGIAFGGDAQQQPIELLREADIALYQAKASGRGTYSIYEPGMQARAVERLDRETDLRRALERGELLLYFQPEIDLTTNIIVGVEALLRWQHPRHGLLPPSEIIPLAEETGLIVPIGQWVLEEACRQAAAWQALRPTATPLVMDVNLSARQLQQPDIAAIVASALRESGLDPGALRLEITESTAMQDAEATIHTLQALHDLGVLLAIDDFGTGYSSLAYLRRFPLDTLKIDKSFLVELEHEQSASDIVRAVTHLAAALGMDVTAEGIETAGQLARIVDLDCDRGQGYYFARPLPPDAFEAILRRGVMATPGDTAAAGQ